MQNHTFFYETFHISSTPHDMYFLIYSGTSLNKLPELRTQQKKTSIIRTKILVPTGLVNTFFTSERGKLLYYSKKWPKVLGLKMSVIERFHCSAIVDMTLILVTFMAIFHRNLIIYVFISLKYHQFTC